MPTQKDEFVKLEAANFLLPIARGIVDHPEEIKISASTDVHGLRLTILSNENDKRYLIGIKGSVAQAMQKLLQLWGRRHGVPAYVFVPRSNNKTNA